MKRKVILMIFSFLFFFPTFLFADACTIEGTPVETDYSISINFDCLGDSSDGSITDTSFDISKMSGKLKGMYLYEIETIPGTGGEVPLAYIPKVINSRGTELIVPTARSTTEKELAYPSGGFPLIDTKLTLTSSNIGASNRFNIIVKFVE